MSFYTDVIMLDPRFASTVQCRDMGLLEPVTRAAVLSIIADAAVEGVVLQVTETYRSPARQEVLYEQKATQLQKVGVHGYGLACDFCKVVEGKASWAGDWTFLSRLAVKHGMICGQDWGHPERTHSFRDSDHVQRIGVEDQDRLFSVVWYPDDAYIPVTGPTSLPSTDHTSPIE